MFNGKANYGCDFGVNIWGSHAGVTAHAAEVAEDFAAMASMGVEVVRWFVFTDSRGGVRWNGNGDVAGLTDGFFDDLDAALTIARETGLRLCLVLFDYSWMLPRDAPDPPGAAPVVMRRRALATPEGRARVFDAVIDPVLARYGAGGSQAGLGRAIHSFDVINEPDWVMKRRRAELRAFVRGVADRVHARTSSLVTVGGGRVKFAAEWDDPAYDLDFVQVHLYPSVRHPRRDRRLVGQPAAALGLGKPVLIGEFPGNGDRVCPPDHDPPPYSLSDYLDMADRGGYLGAWPWSFKGVDGFGAVNPGEYRTALARAARSG